MSDDESYSDEENVAPTSPANRAASPAAIVARPQITVASTSVSRRDADDEADAGGKWASPLFDLCCESSDAADHMFAYFLPCIALGIAKSRADNTNPFFNCCCFPFVCTTGTYSLVRIGYGIGGKPLTDCLIGSLLPCCAIRQIYTESKVRPMWIGNYGADSEAWNEEMGNFNDCRECTRSCFCPCFVAHEIHTRLQMQSNLPTNKCTDYACLLPCSMYGQARVTYGIAKQENCLCEDFCCGGFFYPCGLNRALREASRREMTMRQRAYAAGVGAAGKTREGLRVIANSTETAMKAVVGEAYRSKSRGMV